MDERYVKVISAIVVVLGAHIGGIGNAIRYGFLAVSFEKRNIKMFGLIEGSIVFGYMGGFFCRRFSEAMTEKISPRWMIIYTVSLIAGVMAMSGLADFSENNTLFAVLSFVARLLFGFLQFPRDIASLDILKTLYPDKFDFLNGLMQMGFCSGHGVGEYLGVVLYEHFGYKAPFWVTTGLMCVMVLLYALFLPSCPSITLSNPDLKQTGDEEKTSPEETRSQEASDTPSSTVGTSLTPYVWFPMVACMIINCVYTFLQIASTPYLLEVFSVPLSVGGSVLMCLSAGIAMGSFISGAITQCKFFNAYTQMALGSGTVALGLLLMFPNPNISFLYNKVPYLAYPAVLLCGVGDPIITVPTLRVITDLQTMVKGKCSGKTTLSLFSVWIMSSWCAMYAGTIVGGLMMVYLSYIHCSYVFLALCSASIVISLTTGLAVKYYQDEERVPIIKRI